MNMQIIPVCAEFDAISASMFGLIELFIRKLHKKIEPDPDAPKYILTIWGIGYKMNDQL